MTSSNIEREAFAYRTNVEGDKYHLNTVMGKAELRLTVFDSLDAAYHATLSITEAKQLRDFLNGIFP